MNKPTCQTCPYWDSEGWHRQVYEDGRIDQSGYCRRFPAEGDDHDVEGTGVLLGSWPLVNRVDWCGEHPDFPAWIASQKSKEATP